MNIQEKIDELLAEKIRREAEKEAAHKRIIEINRSVGKLQTILKDAKEAVGELFPAEEEIDSDLVLPDQTEVSELAKES